MFIALAAFNEVIRVGRVFKNPGDGFLRKRCGTDLNHFRIDDAFDVVGEHGVSIRVINLNPSATTSRPGKLLGNAFHGNGGYIADNLRQRFAFMTVIGEIQIDFVRDDEKIKIPRNGNDFLQHAFRVHHSRGIVGINDQDSGNCGIVFDPSPQFHHIRVPPIVWIERITHGGESCMGGFRGGVGGVCGCRGDDAGGTTQKPIYFGDGIA